MANIIRIGGGGGSTPTLITKSITQNGTYNASSDNADGYSEVTVDVEGGGVTVYPLMSNNAYFAQDRVSGTNYHSVARSWTFDKAGIVQFADETYGRTDTSSNDGYFDIQLNGSSVKKQYLTSNVDTPILVNPIGVEIGDVLEIVYGFDNNHSNCAFNLHSAINLLVGDSGGVSKTPIYTFNLSQGGAWLNTQVDVSDIDVFLFERVDSGDINNQTIIKKDDIAVYTGGTDVYTNVYRQNNKDMNVRIYNNILYVLYGSTGSSSYETNVYSLSLSDYI